MQGERTAQPAHHFRNGSGNLQIYIGESTTLTASGADSYLWSTGETTASITVSPSETTNYTVIGYDSEGCEAQASVTVRVDGTSVSENGIEVKVFPNPTKGSITIEIYGLQHITILNILGQAIYDATTNSDNITLDMTQFGKGIYMIRIATNGSIGQKQVSVE